MHSSYVESTDHVLHPDFTLGALRRLILPRDPTILQLNDDYVRHLESILAPLVTLEL